MAESSSMRVLPVLLAAAVAVEGHLAPASEVVEMVRSGRWTGVIAALEARSRGIPVTGGDALVMAYAARAAGEGELEREALERAVEDSPAGEVARAELARLLVESEPEPAVALILPLLTRGGTGELRDAAVGVVERALGAGLPAELEEELRATARRTARPHRRRIEAALAGRAGLPGRRLAGDLLERSTFDLPALAAAERLAREPDPTPRERWLIAKTLFRHGRFDAAGARFDELDGIASSEVPRWEVRFLRGRCAFRLGRWSEAGEWYRRAAAAAPNRETLADLGIHLARALELEGRLEEAIEAARHAVVTRDTDDRRLLLARLRLANGQRGHAEAGLARLKGREARDRGEVLLALDALARGEPAAALDRLARARRTREWRAPAAVLAAEIEASAGRWEAAAARLEEVGGELDPYWGEVARSLVEAMPEELRRRWLTELAVRGLAASTAADRDLAAWCVLETGAEGLAAVRARVAELTGLEEPPSAPLLGPVARALWELGLEQAAAAWAPEQFPDADARSAAWSARQLVSRGAAPAAMRAADTARWRSAPGLPERALPESLRRALYPLPHAVDLRRAADAAGIPWALLAGVARAESGWEPTALSAVGARGLTQMMPATAEAVAARAGRPAPRPDELFRPDVALELGARELGRLLERFSDRPAPAVAAYNAGEAQVDSWLAGCGSQCSPPRFVLGVTFGATRGYTAAVLAAASAYRELWTVEPEARTAVSGRSG